MPKLHPDPEPSPRPKPVPIELQDGSLYREQSDSRVFVLYGGAKFWIPSTQILNALGFNSSSVHVVPDGRLAQVPTVPRDDTLLRELSRPEVYIIRRGKKLWIPNPQALLNVGFTSSLVHVVPDGALAPFSPLPNLTGPVLAALSVVPSDRVKPSDVFFAQIPVVANPVLNQEDNSKRPDSIIARDVFVAGWLADDPVVNSGGFNTEDFFYEVLLDPDFIAQMYGPDGLLSSLNGLPLPGNPPSDASQVQFADMSETGQWRGATLNSFSGPQNVWPDAPPDGGFQSVRLHVELNCWHVNSTSYWFRKNWIGRGPAPPGWRQKEYFPQDGRSTDAQSWWPFDPDNPDHGPRNLMAGDYVVLRGALWQDILHDAPDELNAWNQGATRDRAGQIEMHPPDQIFRMTPPPVRKTAAILVVCNTADIAFQSRQAVITPIVDPQHPRPASATLRYQELIDGRFTDMATVDRTVTPYPDHIVVEVGVTSRDGHQGRFKAVYLVWWEAHVPPPH